ncbi:MAG: hypothetical protein IT449_06230 [Phycisphaerales bacterium]|nr:hypothetical protein [Phycisphaerales bacterium]
MARLRETIEAWAARRAGTLPEKLNGRSPRVGADRMFNNPKGTHRRILQAHRAESLVPLEGFQGQALLLHDATVRDDSGLDVDGLG